jgi:hypothetical protein
MLQVQEVLGVCGFGQKPVRFLGRILQHSLAQTLKGISSDSETFSRIMRRQSM